MVEFFVGQAHEEMVQMEHWGCPWSRTADGHANVRAFGGIGQLFGVMTSTVDERGINAGVDESTRTARGFGRFISAAHSGQIQTYLGAVALGLVALLLLYAWLA